jgi:glycosyltransferase involved in cell wall biosynthesis
MNILFVIHVPKIPNTSVYQDYCQRVAFLEEQGHQAAILAPQDFPMFRRWHTRWLPLLYPFSVARYLMKRGREYDLAVFHSYAGWVVNLLRGLVPVFRRLRTITSSHGLEPLYYYALKEETERAGQRLRLRFRLVHGALIPWLLRLSCRRSDRITCLNRKEAAYLVENRWGHPSQISVVPHGVPQEFFIEREYAQRVRRLLFVAQWQPRKGIRYLVEAFSELVCEEKDLELWCVGTILEEENVLASLPEKIRPQVVVRPDVRHAELIKIYQNADLFLFPSLFEGHSTALLEAMATALPIVATPVGAAPDFLDSEVNALVVPTADAKALIASIRRLIQDPGLRERLGREAQMTAMEYAMDRAHNRLISLYRDLYSVS